MVISLIITGLTIWLLVTMIDYFRQRTAPPVSHAASDYSMHSLGQLQRRRAPCFSRQRQESFAYLGQVIDEMHTGDSLPFSGRKIHSYINRIADWSKMSHVAKVYRDRHGRVWAAEVVESCRFYFEGWRPRLDLGGFRLVPIEDYVRKYPGQMYWSALAPEFSKEYSREKCRQSIEASVTWKYGWLGIMFQVCTKTPVVRVITYLLTWRYIDESWSDRRPPFCSWAAAVWDEIAGVDPVPNVAPQLTTPGTYERSLLFGRQFALLPDKARAA